jgi:hypothetical protein
MTLSGSSNLSVSAMATVRSNLGIHQLFAACKAAARISTTESENVGNDFGPFWDDILHDSLVVVTTSVASLESYANELYFEGRFIGSSINAAAAAELSELIDKESVLRKFSTALAFRANKRLDYGATPTQNIDALIKLRNFVVHYRSEWSEAQGAHHKISKVLNGKFDPSPFLPNTEPMLPKAWASRSFACWAIRSVYEFMAYFYAEASEDNPLDKFKSRISQLSGCAL